MFLVIKSRVGGKVSMAERRLLRVVILLGILVAMLASAGATSAQRSVQKVIHPIAFVRSDGVYVTDVEGKAPVRVIAPDKADKQPHLYSRARWSPDGQQFVVSDNIQEESVSPSQSIVKVANNEPPDLLPPIDPSDLLNILPTAWTPDGSQVVYFDGKDVFQVLARRGGHPKVLYTPQISYSIGEANGPEDPAISLAYLEREQSQRRTPFFLAGTRLGVLVGTDLQTPEGGVDTWGLVSFDGKLLWSRNLSTAPVVSPDGRRVVAGYAGYLKGHDSQPGVEPVVLIDLRTGNVVVLPIEPGAVPLGWSADGKSVYFGTRRQMEQVDTNTDSIVGMEMFGEYGWPFSAEQYTLTLWQIPLNASDKAQASKVFETQGYRFGVMTVSDADLPLVLSIVPSSVPMVKALNSGAARKEAEALYPHIQLYAIDPRTGAVRWTMLGGRPAYGKDSLNVVMSP
jgi:hypothetical protein